MDVILDETEQKTKRPLSVSTLMLIQEWIGSFYEFKRDIVKGRLVYRPAGTDKPFVELDDPKLNTICVDADFAGLKQAKANNILMLLTSEYTPAFHPIAEYLERISKKRVTGKIDQLCSLIKTGNDVAFKKYFKKWLASSVANALNRNGCQNHSCLVFTGGQGAGKTTFFNWLCPPELSEYMYTGEIDLKKPGDSIWKLAEYWFINLEEQIKALNRADANTMKQLITLPNIKGRRPYGRLEAQGYRLANFLASTNDDDFLNDPTGSRRFLCFRIMSISLAYKSINIDDIWCEAYHYYKDNPTEYYVTSSEFDELQKNNSEFVHPTAEQEYVNAYFTIPTPGEDFYIMQPTAIRDFIRNETGNQILKERNIGIALKNNGFELISYKYTGTMFSIKAYKLQLVPGMQRPSLEKYHAHENNHFKP